MRPRVCRRSAPGCGPLVQGFAAERVRRSEAWLTVGSGGSIPQAQHDRPRPPACYPAACTGRAAHRSARTAARSLSRWRTPTPRSCSCCTHARCLLTRGTGCRGPRIGAGADDRRLWKPGRHSGVGLKAHRTHVRTSRHAASYGLCSQAVGGMRDNLKQNTTLRAGAVQLPHPSSHRFRRVRPAL